MGSIKYLKRARNYGKVDTSLDKKLENVEWGEFRVHDLFEVAGSKSLDSNAIDFVQTGINFVGRTFDKNGVQGFIEKQKFEPNKPFTITATVIGNYKYVKFQVEPYYCSQNINILTPKKIIAKWNYKIAYYFVAIIQKFVSLYDKQQGGYKLEDIKNHLIKIPILKNGKIDFDFMEELITKLETQRIKKLDNYLEDNNLKDYTLTDEEKQILASFENGKIEWGEFRIGKLFKINSYKRRFDANKVVISDIGKPYVVRTALNNGIRGYINEDEQFLNDGNTISFGQDTATMFYQEKPYFTGDKIKILKSKNDGLNKLNGLFLVETMTKSFSSFSWGGSSFNVEIIGNQLIEIPTNNKKPDYKTMQTLISAIQKQVIKDVVLYVDKKLGKSL